MNSPGTVDSTPAPRRRKVRTRDAVATQQRLLVAAEAEFAAHGYQGARLRNIAQKAGVQPALIHHYFDDKQGLYRAMLDHALSESSTQSWIILEREGDLTAMVDAFVEMLLRFNRRYVNLITILRKEALRGSAAVDVTQEAMRKRVAPILEAVELFLERRQRLGEIREHVAPREIILTALSLCSYPFIERGFLETCLPEGLINDDVTLERRKKAIVDAVLSYSKR